MYIYIQNITFISQGNFFNNIFVHSLALLSCCFCMLYLSCIEAEQSRAEKDSLFFALCRATYFRMLSNRSSYQQQQQQQKKLLSVFYNPRVYFFVLCIFNALTRFLFLSSSSSTSKSEKKKYTTFLFCQQISWWNLFIFSFSTFHDFFFHSTSRCEWGMDEETLKFIRNVILKCKWKKRFSL